MEIPNGVDSNGCPRHSSFGLGLFQKGHCALVGDMAWQWTPDSWRDAAVPGCAVLLRHTKKRRVHRKQTTENENSARPSPPRLLERVDRFSACSKALCMRSMILYTWPKQSPYGYRRKAFARSIASPSDLRRTVPRPFAGSSSGASAKPRSTTPLIDSAEVGSRSDAQRRTRELPSTRCSNSSGGIRSPPAMGPRTWSGISVRWDAADDRLRYDASPAFGAIRAP